MDQPKTDISKSPLQIDVVDFATPAYDQAVQLRTDILRIPLGLEFYAEDLAKEYDQQHLVCYQGAEMVGCLSLMKWEDGAIKMRQVAIAEAYQKKGIGGQLVKASEDLARSQGYQTMILHARLVSVPFYEKIGYKKVGRKFKEVNIPHYKMQKTL